MLERRIDQIEMRKRVSRAGEVGRGQAKCEEREEETEVPVQFNCKFGYDSSWKQKEHTQATSNCKESRTDWAVTT